MKTKILQVLYETDDYISGQQLCDLLGVSRTAIWKVMNSLKEEGYEIEAVSNRGYKLLNAPERLSKSEIACRLKTDWAGNTINYFDEIDSTNIFAKKQGDHKAPHGTLVVAATQTDGRGRRGKSWESLRGSSVSMSLVLRPPIAPRNASMLTLVMALAVVKAIQAIAKVEPKIKWPNDILVNEKKVCGILTEMNTEADYIQYVVIGVGINVNTCEMEKEKAPYATSLQKEAGLEINRSALVASILFFFEEAYALFLQTQNMHLLQEEYNKYLINTEKIVRIIDSQGEKIGKAKGINTTGELLVEMSAGEIEAIYAGEVSVRGIYDYV